MNQKLNCCAAIRFLSKNTPTHTNTHTNTFFFFFGTSPSVVAVVVVVVGGRVTKDQQNLVPSRKAQTWGQQKCECKWGSAVVAKAASVEVALIWWLWQKQKHVVSLTHQLLVCEQLVELLPYLTSERGCDGSRAFAQLSSACLPACSGPLSLSPQHLISYCTPRCAE